MTKIKIKNIVLRHIKISDAKVFFEAEQDEDAKENFMKTPNSVDDVKESIREDMKEYKKSKPKSEKFAIEKNGECVGWIAINQLNVPFFEHKAKIDFCLHSNFRGQKIMSIAVSEITKYALKRYKLKRLEGWCRTFNIASHKVFEKSGYELEGVLRKNKCKNGKYLDDMIWAKVV